MRRRSTSLGRIWSVCVNGDNGGGFGVIAADDGMKIWRQKF
jgi:hypothetical protein